MATATRRHPRELRHRGRDGLLKVTESERGSPFAEKMIAAAERLGLKYNPDYNGAV